MLWYVLYKSSIDIEPLSLTLHGVNACFIHHPSNVENYSISQKSETAQPKKKKRCVQVIYFYTFLPILGSKFKIPIATETGELFWHLTNWHLTAHQKALQWDTQKS